MKRIKALVLFSGGLDSTLAVKVLEKQNIEVLALTFVSYFFDDGKAKESAEKNNIKFRSVNFSEAHCEVVKKPKRGYGSAMNPCIDCHLLMIKEAGKIMQAEGFDFVATGEILGQRPMSQNLRALKLIEKESGIAGKFLRPLSAKILDETEVEKEGLVDREQLLDIYGRSRKRQLELVKDFGINYFPAPGGGCLLTEKEFGKRLKDLLTHVSNPVASDYELIKFGRHFWLDGVHIALGKNEQQNERIKTFKEKSDIIMELRDIEGPTALLRGKVTDEIIKEAKRIIVSYSKQARKLNYENLEFIAL